jgi:hypothetical protein
VTTTDYRLETSNDSSTAVATGRKPPLSGLPLFMLLLALALVVIIVVAGSSSGQSTAVQPAPASDGSCKGIACPSPTSQQGYPNLVPHELQTELEIARKLKVKPKFIKSLKDLDQEFERMLNTETGKIIWAVLLNGDLVVLPKQVNGVELRHTVLSNGANVLSAGEANIAGVNGIFIGTEINNVSGHYQPDIASLIHGKNAFAKVGINFP